MRWLRLSLIPLVLAFVISAGIGTSVKAPAQLSVMGVGPVSSGAAWTPASLGANLMAWYKADAGVYSDAGITLATNGQTVQQWNDQSGNGYHLSQATSGLRPTFQSAGFNAKQSVTFAAAINTKLVSASDAVAIGTGTTSSAFVVGQMLTGTVSFGRLISYLGNGNSAGSDVGSTSSVAWMLRDSINNAFSAFRNSSQLSISAISLATNYRLGVIFDGANATTYVNNVAGTGSANSNAFTSPGTFRIGTDSSTTNSWDGAVAEIVVTNSALSAGDRTSLDNYFKSHWGL